MTLKFKLLKDQSERSLMIWLNYQLMKGERFIYQCTLSEKADLKRMFKKWTNSELELQLIKWDNYEIKLKQ